MIYGAISFSGVTSQGPFWRQILDGEKTQTIRRPRRDLRPHVKVGHSVRLYWKMRIPIAKKPIHLIGLAKVTAYEELTLAEMWYDRENARADGFGSLDEFRDWFDPSPSWRGYLFRNGELDQYVYKRIKWSYPITKFQYPSSLLLGLRVGGGRVCGG